MATQKMATALPFKLDSWEGGSGQGFFIDGMYQIQECRAVNFDYMGKVPGGVCTLALKLQPVNRDFKPEGDPQVQNYGFTVHAPGVDKDEWVQAQNSLKPSKDGKSIQVPEGFSLSRKCDAFLFFESLQKAGFDMDQLEDTQELSAIDGLICEMGKVPSTRKPGPNAKLDSQGNPFQPQTVVVKSIPANPKAAGGKTNGKAVDAPASKNGNTFDPEALMQEYLLDNVLIEGNAGGVDKMRTRIGIGGWIQKEKKGDAELVAKVVSVFNSDALPTFLSSVDWKIETVKNKQVFLPKEQ